MSAQVQFSQYTLLVDTLNIPLEEVMARQARLTKLNNRFISLMGLISVVSLAVGFIFLESCSQVICSKRVGDLTYASIILGGGGLLNIFCILINFKQIFINPFESSTSLRVLA